MFDFSPNALFGQLLLGLMNGSFYALLSLGLAVIFGMLNIVNFAHGAQYMLGAFAAVALGRLGLGYWWALLLAPLAVGIVGLLTERLFLRRVANLNHLYGMLLIYGLTLVIQGAMQSTFGASSLQYSAPEHFSGGIRLPFLFLPYYRLWVVLFSLAVCGGTWYVIERTRIGAYLRAATENPTIVRTFGINVPLLITLTYCFGVGLAGLAGVLAAPIYQVRPMMGADLLIIVFAVVVIGGMGSILGSIVMGFGLGLLEGLVSFIYPQASTTAVFLVMVLVLIVRPAGLFGWVVSGPADAIENEDTSDVTPRGVLVFCGLALLVVAVAPLFVFPYVLMQAMCLAIYALSVGFLIGYVGLLSFGHAMFLGAGSYAAAHLATAWGVPSDLAMLVGVVAAAVLAYAVGLIALRRQGIYFAMITLAIAQMLYFAAMQAPFTHGEDGIQKVPQTDLLGFLPLSNPKVLYVVVSAVFVLAILALARIVNSPFGEVLRAVRDNEARAVSLGYNAGRYKLVAFVISGALAGLAGAMKAIVSQSANLSDMHWSMSGEALLMALIGGIGSLYGPVVGAFIVFAIVYYFASLGEWVVVVQGVVFVACVMLFRRGLVGEALAWWQARRARRGPTDGVTGLGGQGRQVNPSSE
ncbi:ABC transporter permease [Rhodoferax sediminis]|uniref:Branched-chain amino acid ABC transporter permease n=1 Tax=Rhodoferax sediminis TaxID=2509614 RepID=A0A515DDX9_9BURK|nr:branched-chain amino acid ABC transporter permease [Rhodoferax sediminis]QDL38616.1 branched-chain amino acid ABC transporter permease [Rhodoferax sediminis]